MANVYPNLFAAFMQEALTRKNNIITQGVTKVEVNPLVSKSGQYFTIPTQDQINSILGDATAITSPSTTITPTALSSYNENGLVAHIGQGIKDNELERKLKGVDGLRLIYPQIAPYMLEQAQKFINATITGVFDTALATSHTFDATSVGDGTFSYDALAIGTQTVLGEAFDELDTIIMHSKIYSDLNRKGLVAYVSAADFGAQILWKGNIGIFNGKKIVVNDTITAPVSDVYSSYVIAGQPFYLGYQSALRVETQRKADVGGGTDEAYFYMDFVPHVFGVSYTGSITNPTTTTYSTGSNWTKVAEDKSIKIVKIKTNPLA